MEGPVNTAEEKLECREKCDYLLSSSFQKGVCVCVCLLVLNLN